MKRLILGLLLTLVFAPRISAQAIDALGQQYVRTQNRVDTATGTLTTQCADPCQGAGAVNTSQIAIALGSATGFSFWLTAVSSPVFTIKFEDSFDFNDWQTLNTLDLGTGNRATSFANPASPPKQYAPFFRPGARYARVRISSSSPTGSVSFVVTTSNVGIDPWSQLALPAVQVPSAGYFMFSGDTSTSCNSASCGRPVSSTNAAPAGTEYGLITRPIIPNQFNRTAFRYYATAVAAGTTGTETLFTLTKSSGTAATSTGTSFVITSGKKFRITNIIFASDGNATATTETTTWNFRVNAGGACIVSSTPIVLAARTVTPATSLAYDRISIPFNEGWEIAGDGTLAFCLSANAVYTTNAPTWDAIIEGYEY